MVSKLRMIWKQTVAEGAAATTKNEELLMVRRMKLVPTAGSYAFNTDDVAAVLHHALVDVHQAEESLRREAEQGGLLQDTAIEHAGTVRKPTSHCAAHYIDSCSARSCSSAHCL